MLWKDGISGVDSDSTDFDPVTVNFYVPTAQLSSDIDDDYLAEPGERFGERDNGYTYGWACAKDLGTHDGMINDCGSTASNCSVSGTYINMGHTSDICYQPKATTEYHNTWLNYWKMEVKIYLKPLSKTLLKKHTLKTCISTRIILGCCLLTILSTQPSLGPSRGVSSDVKR